MVNSITKERKANFWMLVCICLLSWSCANVIPPKGGEKDEIPPKVIEAASTPNFQTNYQKTDIELTFDEWILLEDVINQVLVSPPLEYRPEVKLKKRTVRFRFDEKENLRSDATYTINFGEAVKDLNEKNPAENLRFVFATGEKLDSLSVNGSVYDVLTNEPIENALFMLYENLADSVVSKERPFYFAKTNKEGICKIENVKAGTFKVFALVDGNLDYKYNLPTEKIAFLDSNIIVLPTNNSDIRLPMFEEKQPLTLFDHNANTYGQLKLVFNQISDEVEVMTNDSTLTFLTEWDRDTMKLWYSNVAINPWEIYVKRDTNEIDTIVVNKLDKQGFLNKAKLLPVQKEKNTKINTVAGFSILFNHPLSKSDASKIQWKLDSVIMQNPPVPVFDSLNRRKLVFNHNWKEGEKYEILIEPGAIQDIFAISNDTIKKSIEVQTSKELGNINLNISGLDTLANYIVQLLNNSDAVVKTYYLEQVSTFTNKITALAPGNYKIKIISDENGNQRWDTGNYVLKIQPESIYIEELDQLRANWDLDVTVNL